MAKVKVTVKHIETATFNTGDIPVALVRDLLTKHKGKFSDDGLGWSLGDLDSDWETESVELEEL